MIFPEGTRRAPGAEPRYKYGVAHLYARMDVPCLPVALNSGLFWPRRAFRRFPGTVRVEVLDPIQPGLDKDMFFERLQRDIESATARLVAEGRRELASGTPAHRWRRRRRSAARCGFCRASRDFGDAAAAVHDGVEVALASCVAASRAASRCKFGLAIAELLRAHATVAST